MLFDHALNTFFECLTFFFSAFYEFSLKLTDKTWEIEKLPLRNDAVFFLPSFGPENGARPPHHPVSPNVAKSRMA